MQVFTVIEEIDFLPRGQERLQEQKAARFRRPDVAVAALARLEIEVRQHVRAREKSFTQPEDINDTKGNRPQGLKRGDGNASGQVVALSAGQPLQVFLNKFADHGEGQVAALVAAQVVEDLQARQGAQQAIADCLFRRPVFRHVQPVIQEPPQLGSPVRSSRMQAAQALQRRQEFLDGPAKAVELFLVTTGQIGKRNNVAIDGRGRLAVVVAGIHEPAQPQAPQTELPGIQRRLSVAALCFVAGIPGVVNAQRLSPLQPLQRIFVRHTEACQEARIEQDCKDPRTRERLQGEVKQAEHGVPEAAQAGGREIGQVIVQQARPPLEDRLDDRTVPRHVGHQHGDVGLLQRLVFVQIMDDAVVGRFHFAKHARAGDDLHRAILL